MRRTYLHDVTGADLPTLLLDESSSVPPLDNSRRVFVNRNLRLDKIEVIGFDKPQRAEGRGISGALLDEYADMKPEVFTRTIRPALSTNNRPGWCDFIGKPRGRNHFYELWRSARTRPGWAQHHWISETVVEKAEVDAARAEMDELSFEQEYMASFVNFSGRAYYPYNQSDHATERLPYDDARDLYFCFDFNVEPGVAAILQEHPYHGPNKHVIQYPTMAIGEVFIPQNSTTEAVCRKLVADWSEHKGNVICDGDATGGRRDTRSGIQGGDWTIIRDILSEAFGSRLSMRVGKSNPGERDRINAMNSRLKSTDGTISFLLDPEKCPRLDACFEGTAVKAGGSGELDKVAGSDLTHLTDAVGYHIARRYSLRKNVLRRVSL